MRCRLVEEVPDERQTVRALLIEFSDDRMRRHAALFVWLIHVVFLSPHSYLGHPLDVGNAGWYSDLAAPCREKVLAVFIERTKTRDAAGNAMRRSGGRRRSRWIDHRRAARGARQKR